MQGISMRRWPKSVAAKFTKCGQERPPGRPQWQVRLGLETLEAQELLSGSPLIWTAPSSRSSTISPPANAGHVQVREQASKMTVIDLAHKGTGSATADGLKCYTLSLHKAKSDDSTLHGWGVVADGHKSHDHHHFSKFHAVNTSAHCFINAEGWS